MYPAPNTNTPFSTDYRGLLVAKITAIHNPTTGPFAGRPVYEWTEQQITSTGDDEDATPPRKGVYTSALITSNILLDVNDNELVVGQYVWARMKGMTGGITVYETVSVATQNSATSPPVSNCTSASMSLDDADCITIYVMAGQNYCDNIVAVTLTATAFGSNIWVADTTIPLAGGAAGLITVYKDADGNYQVKIDVYDPGYIDTVLGKFVACVGTLSEYAFSDALLCGGVKARCSDNTFRVRFGCTSCPEVSYLGTCDEGSCPDGAPGAYTFTLSGGTTDFAGLNGTWAIIYDSGAGEWTATRGGWTATLTFDGTPLGVATLEFVFDAFPLDLNVVYEINPMPADCYANMAMTEISHTGTGTRPTGPTLASVGVSVVCPVSDIPCCDPIAVPTELTITFGGANAGLGTTTLTWNGTYFVSPTDFGDWCGNPANKATCSLDLCPRILTWTITGPPVTAPNMTGVLGSCSPLTVYLNGSSNCGAYTAVVTA